MIDVDADEIPFGVVIQHNAFGNFNALGARFYREIDIKRVSMAIFLKYYASENERRQWREECPSDALPRRCPLPYDRDRNLLRPELR